MAAHKHSPTYEIVGQLTRFDERDTVFSRMRLTLDSPEGKAYYAAHPERAKSDRRLNAFLEPKERSAQIDAALSATRHPALGMALPDVADGETASTRVESDPTEMAARIKTLARYLGAADARIGLLNPAWVYSHRGSPPFFPDHAPNAPHYVGLPPGYQGLTWGDPINVPHRYTIAMAFAQNLALTRTGGPPFAQFASGRVYAFSALVASQLAAYIRALGWPARAHHFRNYGVLVVPVAVDTGLGELGRCGYLIHPRLGANARLACVTTDLPLAVDPPVNLGIQDFCTRCKKCATTCPPGAIPQGDPVVVRGARKWKIDAEKCVLYWGRRGSCAICQTICPWTKPPTLFHRIVAQAAIHVPWSRRFLVWADDLVYGEDFRPAAPPAWLRREVSD